MTNSLLCSTQEQNAQVVCHCYYPRDENRLVCGYCMIWDWVFWQYGDYKIDL